MNPVLVFLLLLKASATSFSGLTSMPVVRHDFVETRHAMTDRELNAAGADGSGTERPLPGERGVLCGRLRGVPRAGVSDHSDPALSGLARDALTGWIPVAIAVASFLFLVLTRRETLWVMAGAALVGLLELR